MSKQPAYLLILDLDETLIHAADHSLGRAPDFRVDRYFVYKRPHLELFLKRCTEHFELALWTSATADYAKTVLRRIQPPQVHFSFIWARDRCTQRMHLEQRRYVWIKDLKKIKQRGYPLERIIVVDDSPEKLARQYGNLVRVAPYEGAEKDDELLWLARYLPRLKEQPNVRRVEKRGWRTLLEREANT